MELTLLLPLLASLQSLPWPVSPTGLLPAPTLSLEHQLTVLLPAQTAEFTCQAPQDANPSGYTFFYQTGQEAPSTVSHDVEGFVLKLTAEKARAGSYTCAYWTQGSKRHSANSSSISISIAAPQLTVSPPQPVYITGENVTLTCSAAGVDNLTKFRFYKGGEKTRAPNFHSVSYHYKATILLSNVSVSEAGVYSCEYSRKTNNDDLESERSQNVSIAMADQLPTPELSVSPQQPVYLTGESVTLTCSAVGAPNDSTIWFYKDGQKMLSKEFCLRPRNATASLRLSVEPGLQNSTFTCGCWRVESGREIESKSQPISIPVMDPRGGVGTLKSREQVPDDEWYLSRGHCREGKLAALRTAGDHLPQPTLSMDPSSAELKEGGLLLLTCTAQGDSGKQKLPSSKDGAENMSRNKGSETKTMEPGPGSVNISAGHIHRIDKSDVIEFVCQNKKNMSRTWNQAVNVTVDVPRAGTETFPMVLLIVCVTLILLGVLAGLLWWGCRKTRTVKPVEGPAGSEPKEQTSDKDSKSNKKQSKATGAVAEQDSDVTYAQIALDTRTTQAKTRARPAKEEPVLYSEVATKGAQKTTK